MIRFYKNSLVSQNIEHLSTSELWPSRAFLSPSLDCPTTSIFFCLLTTRVIVGIAKQVSVTCVSMLIQSSLVIPSNAAKFGSPAAKEGEVTFALTGRGLVTVSLTSR